MISAISFMDLRAGLLSFIDIMAGEDRSILSSRLLEKRLIKL